MWFNKASSDLGKELLQSIDDSTYTPDRLLLEQYEHVLYFEYGELQTGLPHHHLLDGHRITEAFSEQRFYTWNFRGGDNSFPIATMVTGKGLSRDRVRGELYMVEPDFIFGLDKYRRNGVSFRRKLIPLILPQQDEDFNFLRVPAWTYVGHRSWKDEIIFDTTFRRGRGDFFPGTVYEDVRRPAINRYVHFTINDFQERDPRCFLYTKTSPLTVEVQPEDKKQEPPKVAEHQRKTTSIVMAPGNDPARRWAPNFNFFRK